MGTFCGCIVFLCRGSVFAAETSGRKGSLSGDSKKEQSIQKRYTQTLRIAWFALIPAFLYGFMEAVLNSNFALYGLRIGLDESALSLLLPVIGIGGLALQLPLGMLSDRIGRKKVLLAAGIIGGLCFLLVPLAGGTCGLSGYVFSLQAVWSVPSFLWVWLMRLICCQKYCCLLQM
ncbi:MFS transporter [Paenibacillus larvae]|nr:MFS transporter [Paenibacillus larvae]MDT2236737.1 MFS transporter [Paenibacillus larvae]